MDFTKLPTKRKAYGGANGSKLSIVYNNETYMVKFPSHANKYQNLSYANSCVSEFLSCHIFNMLGIPAQETILGTYEYHGKTRQVVACKDFVKPNHIILDFASVKNQIIDSSSNGYGTDIDDILQTINDQKVIDPILLSDHFWNMFVVDALIGNWDRHNGNWGFLYNQETDEISLAPIYDCGSSLFPQIDDGLIKKVLSSKAELNARVYDIPTSAIMVENKRGNYYKIITSHKYEGCDKALKRIVPRIDLDAIDRLIDSVDSISELQRTFLKKIIKLRKELILDAGLNSIPQK